MRCRNGLAKPAVWERAIEFVQRPVLNEDRTFIVTSTGSVLWYVGTMSGLVDWEAASVAPPLDGPR
jgi:hypothetical protein